MGGGHPTEVVHQVFQGPAKNNHKDEYFLGLFSFSFVVPLITLRITTWELHSFSRQKRKGGRLKKCGSGIWRRRRGEGIKTLIAGFERREKAATQRKEEERWTWAVATCASNGALLSSPSFFQSRLSRKKRRGEPHSTLGALPS